jgi:hypothetical protein
MHKLIFIILIFIPALSFAENLVGTIVPPYPAGFTRESSACISEPYHPERICDFAIEVISMKDELRLLLEKSAPTIEPKKARWQILDWMPYPRTSSNERVVFAMCERNDNPDKTVIAVVKHKDAEWYTDVVAAFIANLAKGRFEAADTAGIRCINEGWGL